jgi:hypothetical protein
LTTAVVFTADTDLIGRFQEFARAARKQAAQWSHEQAKQEMLKVVRVQQELERQGQALPESFTLLQNAQERLDQSQAYWERHLFGDAYREAQRALRPLQMLMRAQWEKAVSGFDAPVASPYAVSYYTLPKHWEFVRALQQTTVGNNVMPGGDFEQDHGQQAGWAPQLITRDEVTTVAERIGQGVTTTDVVAKSGKLCAKLEVKSKNLEEPPGALERTFAAVHSPEVRLAPGTLVQVSGWVYIPQKIQASADGVLFYDSAGGEPLAVRLTEAKEWKRILLYRQVPASGVLRVTLALSGIGTAYFDDIQVRPLTAGTAPQNETVLRPASGVYAPR